MALSYTRLFCRRGVDFHNFRSLYTSSPRAITTSMTRCSTLPVCETHDEKNARLKRPLSPHIMIYKFQIPAWMSITHRATGIILAGYGMALSFATIFVSGGMPGIIASIDAMCIPIPLLFIAKYFLAVPATYHYFNGIRHLLWDLGKFLSMKQVYSTGYTVIGLTIVSALALAAIF